MPDRSFRPRPGRFGLMVVETTIEFPATPFPANVTTTYQLPPHPGNVAALRFAIVCNTVGVDADGTLVVRLFKRRASDDARTQLTADFNAETLVSRERSIVNVTLGTEAQRTLADTLGDTFEFDLVSNSAVVDTQPTNLKAVVEMALLR